MSLSVTQPTQEKHRHRIVVREMGRRGRHAQPQRRDRSQPQKAPLFSPQTERNVHAERDMLPQPAASAWHACVQAAEALNARHVMPEPSV